MSHNVYLNRRDQTLVARQTDFTHIIDLRHRVLRAGLPRSEAIFPGDEFPTSFHFAVFNDAAKSGALCCATFHLSNWEEKPAYQLRGMATDPEWAGQGLGRAVLKVAIDTITAASPIRTFWCNGRLIAIPFYEKLGWKIVSDLFEIPYAGPHYRLLFHSTAK